MAPTPQEEEDRRKAGDSEACAELLELIGRREVKDTFLTIREEAQLEIERGSVDPKKNFNAVFHGNPGTGKSTVADLYSALLQELNFLPEGSETEKTTAAKLKLGGVKDLQGLLGDGGKLAEGGVLFVDEAHQLNEVS